MANKARLGRDPLAKANGGAAAKQTAPSLPKKSKSATGAARIKPKAAAEATLTAAAPMIETPSEPVVPLVSDAATAAPPPAVPTVVTGQVTTKVLSPEAVSEQKTETTDAPTKVRPTEPAPEAATATTPLYGPHPVEVFLQSVLEGLPTTETLVFSVEVDVTSATLPAEKLFYFSHILQLLLAPLECALAVWRKPDRGGDAAAARLTVRLARANGGRHCLRVADNGLFFRSYLPEVTLDTEPLRPLLLFVVKRDGSICLKQGRCVEFEITG